MEWHNFFQLLKKHKYTLLATTVVAILVAYFLVRNQPNKYASQAKLATGIVDQTQKILNSDADEQESKISQKFSNLMEMLRSKKILDQISYSLIIHDLSSNDTYTKPSTLLNQLNSHARKHALQTFTELYKKKESLSLYNPDQNGLNKLLVSLRYDDKSILNNLNIYRLQNSDYIVVQYDSENPKLSADIVNSLCNEFINYYTLLVKENQKKAVDFWSNLLHAKEDTLNKRMVALKSYKIRNHVLNLNEKAKSLYGQIADFETRREEAEKTAKSTEAAINNIDKRFNPNDRKYLESTKIAASQQLLTAKAQLEQVNEAYVKSNFSSKYKNQADSLKALISEQIEKLSDKYVLNPLAAKQNLVEQKLTLQLQHELAKNSSKTIDVELARLYAEFDSLVPHEGTVQALENAISVASQEYLEILQKYNQTNVVSKFSIQLRIIEPAEPEQAEASKKALIVIIAGLVAFIFYIVVLFIIFFFDHTIKDARDLANKTKIPVLGYINQQASLINNHAAIWDSKYPLDEYKQFIRHIQSLRFEIDSELLDSKVLLINSIEKGEGKTLVAINLAYSYIQLHKKVLVIDANFDNPTITQVNQIESYLEDYLNNDTVTLVSPMDGAMQILGNKGNGHSLLEISNVYHIAAKLEQLKSVFDIIIIESSALVSLNKAKEWVMFADKVVTVFEAGKSLTETDKQYIEYLKQLHNKFIGWVLNYVPSGIKSKK